MRGTVKPRTKFVEPTPRPWYLGESKSGAWFVYGPDDTQPVKPHIRVSKRGTKLEFANAKLIVDSVNEARSAWAKPAPLLQERVEALEKALMELGEAVCMSVSVKRARLKAALAEAERVLQEKP